MSDIPPASSSASSNASSGMSDIPPASSSASSNASSWASSSSGNSSSNSSSWTSSNSASSSSSSSSHGLSSGAIAITASFVVVGGVVLIVLAVLIIKYVQKRMLETTSGGYVDEEPLNSIVCGDSKKVGSIVESGDSKNMEESLVDDSLIGKPKKFTSKELEILTGKYREKLGSGGFGDVYKGGAIHGEPFAVKILRDDLGERAEGQFISEVGILGRTNHVNLVRLYGYCFDDKTKALVYEYMENGSLDRYLKSDNIKWQQLYEIAVGTAKGIQYLHEECHQQIIHYDIKPANILLSKNWSPKIADFGLAEMFERQKTLDTIKNNIEGNKGTPGFAAPEIWMPGFPVTPKCDVYSFGKVLFEMLWSTWDLKFKEQQQDLNELKFESWVRKKVDGDQLGSVISNCGDEEDREKIRIMCKVALQCVRDDPGERPSMSEVVRKLNPDNKKDELTATA